MGSTASAPNTPSVHTGSVEAIKEPKMRHSVMERLMGSKRWKENRPDIITPASEKKEKKEPIRTMLNKVPNTA